MQCQGTVSNVPVWTSDEAIGSHWMDKAAEHSASRTCAQAWVMTAMTATAEDDNTDPRTEDNAIFVRSGGKTIVTIFRCGLQKIFLLSAGGRLPSWHVLPNSPWSYQGRQPQGCARRRHSQVGCARTATCLTHSCGSVTRRSTQRLGNRTGSDESAQSSPLSQKSTSWVFRMLKLNRLSLF